MTLRTRTAFHFQVLAAELKTNQGLWDAIYSVVVPPFTDGTPDPRTPDEITTQVRDVIVEWLEDRIEYLKDKD